MDNSWKAHKHKANKTPEIFSLWWCSLPWHVVLFLSYWSESEGRML